MATPNGDRTRARIWLVVDSHLVPVVRPRQRLPWWRRTTNPSAPPDSPFDAMVPMDQPTAQWLEDLATLESALDLFTRLANEPLKSTLIAAARSAVESTAPRGIAIHVDLPAPVAR